MGVNFNLVAVPRPYSGLYAAHYSLLPAAPPLFFVPHSSVRPTTAAAAAAAAVAVITAGALSNTFRKNAGHPPSNPDNRMYLQPGGNTRFTAQQVIPPQPSQSAPPKVAEPPKVVTVLADALNSAKGLGNGSNDHKAVAALQKFLKSAGYGSMLGKTGNDHDGIDGIFKGRTKSALEQFQADNHLPKTGVLDEATIKKMHEVEQKGFSTSKPEGSKASQTPKIHQEDVNVADEPPAAPYKTRGFNRPSPFPPLG